MEGEEWAGPRSGHAQFALSMDRPHPPPLRVHRFSGVALSRHGLSTFYSRTRRINSDAHANKSRATMSRTRTRTMHWNRHIEILQRS